jgi:hypothetical protein
MTPAHEGFACGTSTSSAIGFVVYRWPGPPAICAELTYETRNDASAAAVRAYVADFPRTFGPRFPPLAAPAPSVATPPSPQSASPPGVQRPPEPCRPPPGARRSPLRSAFRHPAPAAAGAVCVATHVHGLARRGMPPRNAEAAGSRVACASESRGSIGSLQPHEGTRCATTRSRSLRISSRAPSA